MNYLQTVKDNSVYFIICVLFHITFTFIFIGLRNLYSDKQTLIKTKNTLVILWQPIYSEVKPELSAPGM